MIDEEPSLPQNFNCPHCLLTYCDSEELEQHVHLHIDELPFKCTLCHSTLGDRRTLDQHVISHAKYNLHICPVCERIFESFESMKTHFKNDHKPYNPDFMQNYFPLNMSNPLECKLWVTVSVDSTKILVYFVCYLISSFLTLN